MRSPVGAPVLAACACLALARPGMAQPLPLPRALGQPVVSQSLAIDARPVSDPALLELIQTRVGTPLTVAAVRESIAHFMGLGRFDDVVVSVAEGAGGVVVTYDLVPARAVGRVVFHGQVAVSESLLRDRIEERFGAAFPLARLDDLAPFLTSVYHDQGYLQARLTSRAELGGAHDTVTVDVEAGPRVTLSTVVAEGNAPMPLAEIPRRLDLQTGQFYRKGDVDSKLERLVADLREQGYYEARADHQLRPATDGTAELLINVDGGARITVVFEGDPLPEKQRRELVPIEREGSVDEDLLEDSANRIEGYLRAQGYRDADAEYQRTPQGWRPRRRVHRASRPAVPHGSRDHRRGHRGSRGRLACAIAHARRRPVRRGGRRVGRGHAGRAVPPSWIHAGARRSGIGAAGRQRVAGPGGRAPHRHRGAEDGRRRHHDRRARPPSTRPH